jgi:uncharacterized membrane-anchored protein
MTSTTLSIGAIAGVVTGVVAGWLMFVAIPYSRAGRAVKAQRLQFVIASAVGMLVGLIVAISIFAAFANTQQ